MDAEPAALPEGIQNRMLLELPARAANLSLARAAVAAFAAQLPFTVDDLEDIKLAVSEAVSNVVLHAYAPGAEGAVHIEAFVRGEVLEVLVADTGRGIADIAQARQPAFTTAPDRMGLGFVLMDTFMDELCVDSAPGRGTRVTLRKHASCRDEQGGCDRKDGAEPADDNPPV
jgi:stage II sporulation protein AB (anti-sigma F factor)